MKDFFGSALEIGDTVAFIPIGYRDLRHGTIIRFTAQQVVVEFKKQYPTMDSQTETTTRYSSVLIKKVR